jgi:hypothetical protein
MVGTGRFELPTPRTPSECSTRLSHVPTVGRSRGLFVPRRLFVRRLRGGCVLPLCRFPVSSVPVVFSFPLVQFAGHVNEQKVYRSYLPDGTCW